MDRHQVEEWVAERASGGAIVEIGCGYGNGMLALYRGTRRGANLPLYGIDPYVPYRDALGGEYGPATLVEFQTNTAGTGVQLIQKPAAAARAGWTDPIALLWIDVSMAYAGLKAIFDAWQGLVIPGGWICLTGACYPQLGSTQVAREAVASGGYDYALHDQDLVAVLRKKKQPVRRACFYIASGEAYADEADVSAASVKARLGLEVYLFFVGGTHDRPHIDRVVSLPARRHEQWYVDSVGYMNFVVDYLHDYNELLYLDTDTYVAHPCGEMFRLLEHYDMALGHAAGRDVTQSRDKVPPSWTTLGVGVNLFRNNNKIRALFADWQARFETDYEAYGPSDEGPLRDLLFENRHDVRLAVLPPEYHLRCGFGCWLFGRARILHARLPNLEELATEINSVSSMRLWRYGFLWYHGQ